ncbi:MAG: hypothetical protein NWF05_02600 [Candidatus Bathyarchaeota archaeon]|nr:hypothetical protein [Candidatus Bathyarchaeota archaeon]
MSEKAPSKDEALEALDFIVNVLKEHEKDLDRLIDELGTVAGQLGESSELNCRVKKIEDKINGVQTEVSNLFKTLTATPQQTAATQVSSGTTLAMPESENMTPTLPCSLPLRMQCTQWEDFWELSAKAQTAAFTTKETDQNITIEALKNNHLITYTGQMPQLSLLLKTYLSKQLGIPEKQILEGTITLT